jgi:hypothetical protein
MRPALSFALAASLALPACSDPVAPPAPASLVAVSALQQDAAIAEPVAAPAVRVLGSRGRPMAGVLVHFAVESGGGSIGVPEIATDSTGLASAGSWTLGTQTGAQRVTARIAEHPQLAVTFEATACGYMVALDRPLGDFLRLKSATTSALPCLLFDPATAAGHEYLVLLENMPPTGAFDGGLFPGAASHATLEWTLRTLPLVAGAPVATRTVHSITAAAPSPDAHAWDFGAGRIRELQVETPVGGVAAPRLLREGRALDMRSVMVDPVVGDTIDVRMEGIARLGIATGNQKAVIRHVTPHLIIAEDVRLTTTLVRQSGGFNTPLAAADLAAIADEYTAVARVQGDLLFENRHNTATEDVAPNRVIAVHSLMNNDSIWGYTYSSTNYFVWDYWVGTDGVTKGINQHAQRVTDNLFMHEITHMRHWGLLQRAGSPPRGNRWLVEGFARFTERLPIAARLLGSTSPSRTDNVALPLNPAFGNSYFLDDVPTYASAGAGMFFGYQTSAFVFDYFADQVALQGGDWRAALREFVAAAGAQAALDPVVNRWLPGLSFADLFTRARIALYADDIGTTGLPAWTQYHQYRLRQSRPLPAQLADRDPRAAWSRVSPGVAATVSGAVPAGAAAGFIIDGTAAAPRAVFTLSAAAQPNVTVTLVRVR